MIDFNLAKDAINLAKHGISLGDWVRLDVVKTIIDDRFDYGETRFRSYGWLDGKSYCLVFTIRLGAVRPISLRRVRAKEMKRYVSQT